VTTPSRLNIFRMATPAHCAYCFECVASKLEGRKPLSLGRVEELWEIYENGEEEDATAGAAQVDGAAEDEEMKDDETTAGAERNTSFRPAAVSRLLNPSSSSSSSSTPSAASSTPSLSSTTSKASSRTSLFSLPKRFSRGRRAAAADMDEDEYPMFVTWNEVSSRGHKSLRGCIGTFDHWPLEEGLRTYANAS
jgi:hypothetical protein